MYLSNVWDNYFYQLMNKIEFIIQISKLFLLESLSTYFNLSFIIGFIILNLKIISLYLNLNFFLISIISINKIK